MVGSRGSTRARLESATVPVVLRDQVQRTHSVVTSAAVYFFLSDSKALELEPCPEMGREAKPRLSRHKRGKQKAGAKDARIVEHTKKLQAERAAAAMVEMCFPSPAAAPVREPVTEAVHPPPPKRRKGVDEARRRNAIHEIYVNMGEPDESVWRGKGGAVSKIREALRLPAGADAAIHKVLQRIRNEGDDFHCGRQSGGGRHAKLSLAEAMIAADELEAGVGQTQAMVCAVRSFRSLTHVTVGARYRSCRIRIVMRVCVSSRRSGPGMLSTVMYHCPSMGNALGKPRVLQDLPRIVNKISRFSYLNTIVYTPCME